MNYILRKKLKFYTKESLRICGMIVIAFGFITGILFMKYKPIYAVKIGNEHVEDKELFEKQIEENVTSYTAKNVNSVSIKENPEYELKLVQKGEKTNENEIIIAMQNDMEITYKYYEIALDNEVIDSVDSNEEAQSIVNELKEKNKDLNLTIAEKITTNAEDIKTNTIDVAKANITQKVNAKIQAIENAKLASQAKNKTTTKVNSTSGSNNSDVVANGVVKGIKLSVKPVSGTITSRYGSSSSIRSSNHTGLDIATKAGTPIKVVADGTVTSAAYTGSYGNLVKISHGNGVETWYAHTSAMYVTAGQQVKAGDVIAAVGSTGNSTGPHLHFEIRINGSHVNPQIYMYN